MTGVHLPPAPSELNRSGSQMSHDNCELRTDTSSTDNQTVTNDTRVCSDDSGLEMSTDNAPEELQDNEQKVAVREKMKVSASFANDADDNDADDNDADDDGDVKGVYDKSFRSSKWIFVKETDEQGNGDSLDDQNTGAAKVLSTTVCEEEASTPSTPNSTGFKYRRSYKEVSVKNVQRESSIEKFVREDNTEVYAEKLVELTKDETSAEFGIHIKGDHPTKVSEVDKNSIAEAKEIEIGDVILAVNYESVLHKTQLEIVQLIKKSETITLELCKESSFSNMKPKAEYSSTLYSAYMYKLTNSVLNIWQKRWFVLKSDNCLYYYKNKGDRDILGAIPLSGYLVNKATDLKKPKDHSMKLMHHTKTYYFAATNEEELAQWGQLLTRATSNESNMDSWLDMSSHNVGLPALSIKDSDCVGYITKMGGSFKTWRRRYAVLKDGCLYYYRDMHSPSAQGVAHLHGYTVNSKPSTSRKYAFDLVPPESKMRTFHFTVENEPDKERWIRAMKLSIGRWVKVT